MQIKVIKSDGSIEKYMHTKVLGTINHALVLIDQPSVFVAEQFAEAITFHFYSNTNIKSATTDEIHLLVQSVLTATGYENAAQALNHHRINRRINRNRIEVTDYNDQYGVIATPEPARWNKSIIADDLEVHDGLSRDMARVIASSVEEKVLNLNVSRISLNLIKQLVMLEKASMLDAEYLLQQAV